MSENKKCPLCSRKLVERDGVFTCPDCGYRVSGSADGPDGNKYSGFGSSGRNNYSGYGGSVYTPRSSTAGGSAGGNGGDDKDKKKNGKTLGILAAVMAAAAVLAASIVLIIMNVPGSGKGEDGSKKNSAAQQEREKSTGKAAMEVSTPSPTTPEEDTQSGFRPESDMMIELVEIIFDKDLKDITREELDSIVYLDFYDIGGSGKAVEYELADGSSATCIMSDTRVDTTDLKCFGGLEYLFLEDISLDWNTDWSSLSNLYVLECESSLGEIAKVMDVSQLYYLILDSEFSMGAGLGDIAAYTGLKYLALDCCYIDSLDGLSKAPELTALYIANGDRITDFEELYSMTKLEQLSIESSGLRDIGFVSGMDDLKEFEISNTSVKNIDVLADCADTLTTLRLHQNYLIEDYSVVFGCTGLEELELYVAYDFDVAMEVPDLSMLTNLKTLHIGNYDCFTNLKNVPWIETLSVSDAYSGDPEALAGLDNLTTLCLFDMSIEPSFLEPLEKAENLVYLDMEGTFFWGDSSVIFRIPNLQRLYLTDADIGLKLDTMQVCESLQVLDLEGTTFHRLREDGSWDYGAGQTWILLADNLEFFSFFPNLLALYVPEQELEDLSFAADMSRLYYLDISNNYITDLTPLKDLKDLELVICPDNPIHDRTGMEDVILVE